MQVYYIYAILPRGASLGDGLVGLADTCLSVVSYGSIAAAVSMIEWAGFAPSSDDLIRHEIVVESLCQKGPALPVRFGTVFAHRESVTRVLAEREATLRSDLARLGSTVELSLAVLRDPDRSDGERRTFTSPKGMLLSRDAAIETERTDGELPDKGPGARYLRKRRAEYQRVQSWTSEATALNLDLAKRLGPRALESRCAILPTPCLLLNVSYLLQRDQVAGFQEAFEEARQAHPRLRFLLSGPWPPYSFVTPPPTMWAKPEQRGVANINALPEDEYPSFTNEGVVHAQSSD